MTTPRSMFAEHSLELLSGQVLPGQPPILSGFAAPFWTRNTSIHFVNTQPRLIRALALHDRNLPHRRNPNQNGACGFG
jgi:hypothetical protein